MPVTAKLSRKFYEKLGDEVANELVTLLNAVDDSYRQEFRELFASNFGQVRAEMAQLRAEMRGEMAELRAELRGELTEMRSGLRAELHGEATRLRAEMVELSAELRREFNDRLHATERRLIGWMFTFWIGQVGVTVGLILAARQLWR